MRRRSMLMTLAGAGVGLCVPFSSEADAGNGVSGTSLGVSLPRQIRALQALMLELSYQTTGTLQESADEVSGLCDVILKRFEKNGASSPAVLQRCADILNEMPAQLAGSMFEATPSRLIAAHRDAVLTMIGSPGV